MHESLVCDTKGKSVGQADKAAPFKMPSTETVDLTGKTILQVVPELDIGGAEMTINVANHLSASWELS